MRPSLWVVLLAAWAVHSTPPHVLYLVIDDLGWADVSYHNQSDLLTPNLDALARGGIQLDQYYVQPVCSPTRSSFMSGMYPFKTGMQHITTIVPASNATLPHDLPTLPHLLKGVGYSTHMIGKWHLGAARWSDTPTERGFDSYLGYYNGQVDYYNKTITLEEVGYDFRSNKSVLHTPNTTYTLPYYSSEYKRVINTYTNRLESGELTVTSNPLFIYYAHQTVHIPLEAPPDPKYMARCSKVVGHMRQVYCAKMADLDDDIGASIQLLKDKHLWDNTLVVVTTDNGGMVSFLPDGAFPSSFGCNWPLRAGKTTLFEGGVRGIGFVSGGPTALPASLRGKINNALMHAVDIFPTILGRAGVPIPEHVDGHDMWTTWTTGNQTGPRSEVVLNLIYGGLEYSGIRIGDWKFITGVAGAYDGWWPVPGTGNYEPGEEATEFLFNVKDDPNERKNLFSTNRVKAAQLRGRLMWWLTHGFRNQQANVLQPEGLPSKLGGSWGPWMP